MKIIRMEHLPPNTIAASPDVYEEIKKAYEKKPECKFCAEGIPLREYLRGEMWHFDGFTAWTQCLCPKKRGDL